MPDRTFLTKTLSVKAILLMKGVRGTNKGRFMNAQNSPKMHQLQTTKHLPRDHKSVVKHDKMKAPIRIDAYTVINLSNINLTEDEKLFLSWG